MLKSGSSAKHSPEEWRILLGTEGWRHACARQLHGWHEHEHHAGESLKISEAAYRGALDAAQTADCVPDPGALSPYKGKGL